MLEGKRQPESQNSSYLLKNSQAVKKWCMWHGLKKPALGGKSKVAAKNGCNDVNANKF